MKSKKSIFITNFIACIIGMRIITMPVTIHAVGNTVTAKPSIQTIQMNEKPVEIPIYNINGENYFKLQDVAYYIDFSVTYNKNNNSIEITTSESYNGQPSIPQKALEDKEAVLTNQFIYIDGQKMSFTIYNIDGQSYFKLRDLAQSINFTLIFNPEKNIIYADKLYSYRPDNRLGAAKVKNKNESKIDKTETNNFKIPTPGISGEISDTKLILSLQDPPSKEDYSKDANPKVLELTSRDAFNAARQSYLDRKEIVKKNNLPFSNPEGGRSVNEYYRYAHFIDNEIKNQKILNYALIKISYYYKYSIWHPENTIEDNSFKIVRATYGNYLDEHDKIVDNISNIIMESQNQINYKDKIKILAQAVMNKLEYSEIPDGFSGSVFTVDGIKKGNCEGYTREFELLCGAADIPCIDLVGTSINGISHAWNEVYVDGEWLVVDVTNCDAVGKTEGCKDFLTSNYDFAKDSDPDITLLAKEILVPGSTK